MKYYSIVYPDDNGNTVEEVLSEQDILDHYWDWWYEKMVLADKRDKISLENCIKDWIVVNWAMFVGED